MQHRGAGADGAAPPDPHAGADDAARRQHRPGADLGLGPDHHAGIDDDAGSSRAVGWTKEPGDTPVAPNSEVGRAALGKSRASTCAKAR